MDGHPASPGKGSVHARNRSSQSTNPPSPSSSSLESPSHLRSTTTNQRQPYARTPSFEPPSFFANGGSDAGSSSHQGRGGALTVDLGHGVATAEEMSPTARRLHNAEAGRASGSGLGRNRWWPDGTGSTAAPRIPRSGRHEPGTSDPDAASLADAQSVAGPATYSNGAAHTVRATMPAGPLAGGGYSSSASTEGEAYLNAASQLTSRTPTPLIGVNLDDRAAGALTSEATESEGSEYDEQTTLKHGRGSETPKAKPSVLGALGKGWAGEGFWGASASNGHGPTTARARNSKKGKWVKPRSGAGAGAGSDRGWLLNAGGSAPRLRRRPNAALTHPLRMMASFLSKLFRTFFGPIHPVTILVALVLIASFVTSVTKLIIYILNPDKEPLPWRTYCQQQPPFPHAYADALAPVDVFVGIFSVDSSYERRHLIRSTYAAHTVPVDPQTGAPLGNIQVRFIIGRPRKAHARRVALEMEVFNDLVILDMEENMNRGKTHAFFKWAADNATVPFLRPVGGQQAQLWQSNVEQFGGGGSGGVGGGSFGQTHEVARGSGESEERYEVAWKKADYVVKADDDAFIVLEELERHLRVSPRQMTYWGYLIRNWFMGGECYALSSDLVQYVATSENVLHYTKGKEDKKVAQWINLHPNRAAINWVSEHCWIYDHPKAGTAYSHGFLFPDHVEKIKMEGRRGLTDQEIARRGGEHRSKSFSTVRRWHQAYTEPRGDLTIEEEVEALVEGGGRWSGTWVRGEEGNDTQVWVPREQIVYEASDDRLRSPMALNVATHAALADEARDGGLLPKLAALPSLGDLPSLYGADPRERKRAHAIRSAQPRLMPLPSHRDGNGEAEALRAKRYLGRRYGGTVVVHFLKKSEWFYETALALCGRSKSWPDGAGGSGTEWRMYGSPLVRHEDGYVYDGRSQPRPDVEMAYLQQARLQAQANAAQAQGQAARVGSFTKPRSPAPKQGGVVPPPPPPPPPPSQPAAAQPPTQADEDAFRATP
ncbi:uncharacterized protein PFL1_00605 [Pseudozyma flocculosa PF-1]|uniref:uncharacterized protein n=1 Tax=Pseudozyma flocculosa PF-1 TaxID=1277687 RepID=UPI000456025A|nr:uncharacterized protein PFL1_00605 [Pseudozyma flocculosa PF-1]EPQ32409.1 hypothetical protein PFL1_00605 [Pseudozyma flocculosa PF-1]